EGQRPDLDDEREEGGDQLDERVEDFDHARGSFGCILPLLSPTGRGGSLRINLHRAAPSSTAAGVSSYTNQGSHRHFGEGHHSMKRVWPWLAVGFLACSALTGCRPEPLHCGDPVTPVLESRDWIEGQYNNLRVRLQADDGTGPRMLDFDNIPDKVHPKASVTFYHGERAGKTVNVTLSHRC